MGTVNSEFSTALAAVIKKHRLAKGLSQNQLSKLSGVSQSYVGELERGLYSPTVDVVFALSEALGVPFSKMVEQAEKLKKRS
jgi:transcriptional regulator with XRE-family HTH domain